jgi:hypothetical protein
MSSQPLPTQSNPLYNKATFKFGQNRSAQVKQPQQQTKMLFQVGKTKQVSVNDIQRSGGQISKDGNESSATRSNPFNTSVGTSETKQRESFCASKFANSSSVQPM